MNLTDDESRIMPVSGGGFDQCYNAQAGVDTVSQLIVCSHVSQKPNDKQELELAVKELQGHSSEFGEITGLLAGNGYFSSANCTLAEDKALYTARKSTHRCLVSPRLEEKTLRFQLKYCFQMLNLEYCRLMQKKRVNPPVLLGEAVILMATIGGYLNRKKDLPPGHQILWQGYAELQLMCAGILLIEKD